MELYPMLLVMVASVLHLGWNTIAKQAENKLLVLWIAIVIPGVIGSIVCLFIYDISQIPQAAIYCLLLSAVIHAFYFWGLTEAYHGADLSFVYPYTRGIGALFATIGGVYVLHEVPSVVGGIGVLTIIFATILEPLLSKVKKHDYKLHLKSFAFITLTALMIGSYFVTDTIGVRLMPVAPYLLWMLTLTALLLSPVVMRSSSFKSDFRLLWKKGLSGAAFMYAAYGLALMAVQISPIAYVASARALGIIISGLVGWFILKESLSKARILSIVFISLGILLIGLG
jgi:drug/metabolite transporter (DMT)-like permease